MTVLSNNFEAGTDETVVTTSNAGGTGNANFDTVVLNTEPTPDRPQFDSEHVRDTMAVKFGSVGTGTLNELRWTVTSHGTVSVDYYLRFYLYLTANPPATTRTVNIFNGATRHGGLDVGSTGVLTMKSGSNVTIGTATAAVALNAWNRIELWYPVGATSTCEVRLWSTDPDSTGTADSIRTAANVTGQTSWTETRMGQLSTGAATVDLWIDDLAAGDNADWFGPSGEPPPPPPDVGQPPRHSSRHP